MKDSILITGLSFLILSASLLSAFPAQNPDALKARIEFTASRLDYITDRVSRIENGLSQMPETDFPVLRRQLEEFRRSREGILTDLSGCRDQLSNNRLLEAEAKLNQVSDRLNLLSLKIFEVEKRVASGFRKYQKLGGEHVRKAVERTDRALERAVQVIRKSGGNEESAAALRRAAEIQENAKRRLSVEDFKDAYKLTLQARRTLLIAVKGSVDENDAEFVMERVESKYERAEGIIGASRDEKARLILEKGRERLARARDLLESENNEAAVSQARVAAKLIAKAVDVARRGQ